RFSMSAPLILPGHVFSCSCLDVVRRSSNYSSKKKDIEQCEFFFSLCRASGMEGGTLWLHVIQE
ncbi:hypothetical protein, partial [Escherichia coli]|uniref:hypothetical protein n=1 Tax=Escherichia coli TaxID=562 RepID=UPI00200B939C